MMIELLVSLLLCSFALLGYAGLQARANVLEFESLQRSQALVLVDDLVARINANRTHAAEYVSAGLVGAGAVADCAGLSGATRDLCEWGNLLRGVSETRGTTRVGAMLVARGCVTQAAGTSDRYVVTVVWAGLAATGGAAAPCGRGDADFPDEGLRRAVSATVCIARLRDPAALPATPRC